MGRRQRQLDSPLHNEVPHNNASQSTKNTITVWEEQITWPGRRPLFPTPSCCWEVQAGRPGSRPTFSQNISNKEEEEEGVNIIRLCKHGQCTFCYMITGIAAMHLHHEINVISTAL